MTINEITSDNTTIKFDPMKERVALLEQRIVQLEATVERMDALLSAINHRTSGLTMIGGPGL